MMRLITNTLLKYLPKNFTSICEISLNGSFKIGRILQDMGYNVFCLNIRDNENNIKYVRYKNIDCIVSIVVENILDDDLLYLLYNIDKPFAILLNSAQIYDRRLFNFCSDSNATIVFLDPSIELFLDINRRYRSLAWLLCGFDSCGAVFFDSLERNN